MRYYLSLGSNLGNRRRYLGLALAALGEAGVRVERVSSVYRTEPVGRTAQPWFYNLVARADTGLRPAPLLDLIEALEKALGRVHKGCPGPRTIDIDILLAGKRIVRTRRLEIPHPRLEKRNFVLIPLTEIAPGAVQPVLRRTVRSLLKASPDSSSVRKLGLLEGREPAPGSRSGRG